MNNSAQITILIKQFLQLATGLEAKYAYPDTTPTAALVLTYQFIGGQGVSKAIGNELLSERKMFVATIQAKRAKDAHFYVDMIKQATNRTLFMYISESIRKDVGVKNSWIATVVLSYYNSFDLVEEPKKIFTDIEARAMLQAFANRFVFNTSIYNDTIEDSFIDTYEVPPLTEATIEDILTKQGQIREEILAHVQEE